MSFSSRRSYNTSNKAVARPGPSAAAVAYPTMAAEAAANNNNNNNSTPHVAVANTNRISNNSNCHR
jgi:hypothetical protein